MILSASCLLLTWSFLVSLAVSTDDQHGNSFWCGPASTNTNASPSVVCECSSYSYEVVQVAQAPTATSGAVVGLGAVTSTLTVTYTTSPGACSHTAASQASSMSKSYVKTSATSTKSAASMTPSTTPPPMTCSITSNSVCSCDGTSATSVGPGGFCGPPSLSVTATVNCVSVAMSAYQQKDLQGCMCLDHWGPVRSSDLTVGSHAWTDDTQVHILQPREFCNPSSAEDLPFCRAQSFEDETVGCNCQAWPEDNSFEPYQLNNPCLAYPITMSVAASCKFWPVGDFCLCSGTTGSGISRIFFPPTPCPHTTTLDYTTSIDVVTATGSCWSTSTYCSCTASSSAVSFTTTASKCSQGPYTVVMTQD